MASPIQNGELLGMTGRGSRDNPSRVDGSTLEPGIHLRWQMNPHLGFPSGGFDIYRRNENYRKYLRCGSFFEKDLGGVSWSPFSDEHANQAYPSIESTGKVRVVAACQSNQKVSAAFPGSQKIRIKFSEPVRHVRILFDIQTEPNPVAEAYWESSSGDVLIASKRAVRLGNFRYISLFGDHIDYLTLTGEDMVICVLCFVTVMDGRNEDWEKVPLNGKDPIYLPITHPAWHSPHPHAPDDDAEAGSRLPINLPVEKAKAYQSGFTDDLHDILYSLVGTEEHRLYRIKEEDTESGSTLDWPGMTLLQLMALDPNMARILGLYWHDIPPSLNAFYDYRVVGHYENKLLPGTLIQYNHLDTNLSYGLYLQDQDVSYTSPNRIEAVRGTWDGSEQTGLLFTNSILFAPISIRLPKKYASITLKISSSEGFTIKVFENAIYANTINRVAGDHTIHFANSKNMNVINIYPLGELTLFEMELRNEDDVIGDLIYDAYHLRANTSPAVSIPDLEMPVVDTSTTGVDENGIFRREQSRVGLRWTLREAGGTFLEPGAPALFQIQREIVDSGTGSILDTSILNEHSPSLTSTVNQPHYSDQHVPDGSYQYAVRGIDLFGVLGDWSPPESIDVQDSAAPPPPQAVEALYLDPADPWLSDDDAEWTKKNGAGAKISWTWPGSFRLQAPDVTPPHAEFRVYSTLGSFNVWQGKVVAITERTNKTAVATNLNIPGNPDDFANEKIRINDQFYRILTNTTGPNAVFEVEHLTLPVLTPSIGTCMLTATQPGNTVDTGKAFNWDKRLHIEPVQHMPIVTGTITSTASQTDSELESLGATLIVTVDQLLGEENISVPGSLMCNGVLYRVFHHSQDTALHLHIAPVVSPTNAEEMIEPVPGDECEYYPGWRYEIRIPGYTLPIPVGEASAFGQIAISCSDGKQHVSDAPLWSKPGRGGLGNRLGNEGSLSRLTRVEAYLRATPDTISNVPTAPPEPIFAEPANYYGMARYGLSWDQVPGVSGYTVFRCAGSSLFDFDRNQREQQKGAYANGSVFDDDPGFSNWLSNYDPSITEADIKTDPQTHATVWRAWANQFYRSLSDQDIQELANKAGNEETFHSLNQEAITDTQFEDSFDGRGRGFYLYRIRTVDVAGNESTWSDTFPPVHIYDILPPAMPSVTAVIGGERKISIQWNANRESDLLEYWIWRSDSQKNLEDIRRQDPVAKYTSAKTVVETWEDILVEPRTDYYYRIAAVDTNQNVSTPSGILHGRAIDTSVPDPPTWGPAKTGTEPDSVQLSWTHPDTHLTCLVQRRPVAAKEWENITAWLPRGEYTYLDGARTGDTYEYRLSVMNEAGQVNTQFNVLQA